MWAILSDPKRTNGRWDVDEFFATGRTEIAALVADLDKRGLTFSRGRCLDFGCGMGRLTQALGQVFDHADGVDIADTMIELARHHNKYPGRVEYHLNVADDLSLFEDGRFDFIYSTIVLQHNPPPAARRYIEEFLRVLAEGGLAVFDMPTRAVGRELPEGSHRAHISITKVPDRLPAGATALISVEAVNTSGSDWPRGTGLKFGNHWKKADGELIAYDDGRAEVSDPVPDGETIRRRLPVTLPSEPGRYVLEVDLVEEMITWFGALSGRVPSIEVEVVDAVSEPAAAPVMDTDDDEPQMPELFSMNALSPEEVREAIALHGGEILDSRDTDAAGADWESLRYYVRRLDARTAAPRIAEASAVRADNARAQARAAAEQAEAARAAADAAAAEAVRAQADAEAAALHASAARSEADRWAATPQAD